MTLIGKLKGNKPLERHRLDGIHLYQDTDTGGILSTR